MINDFTQDEVRIVHQLFQLKFDSYKVGKSYNATHYEQLLKISRKDYKYLNTEMCLIGEELGLFTMNQSGSGTCSTHTWREPVCEKFVLAGGFEEHFEKIWVEEKEEDQFIQNKRNSVKPKKFWKRPEVVIPV
ncbi:MAG: hypothetical protein HRT71_19375 [Flavobacteriales bacterium]|nr:hypothetical protein [Flavobacteriales bacterium]